MDQALENLNKPENNKKHNREPDTETRHKNEKMDIDETEPINKKKNKTPQTDRKPTNNTH